MMRGMGGPGGGVVNPGNAISHEKKRSALWKLMGLMKPYWPVVAFCCVLGIVLNLANILKPYLMKIAVDEFIGQYEGLGMEKVNELTKDANWFTGTLTGLGVTYFLVILGGQAAGYAQSLMMTKVCQTILHSLRMKAFYHIHHMKLKDLDAMGSGRLLTRSTNDIEALDEFYGDILLSLFKDVFLLAGILAAMFLMSWRLALVSLVMVPAIFAITVACRGALRRNFVKMKALTGRMNGFIAESLSGIRVIQAFNREKEKYAELDDLNRQYLKASIFQVFMNSVLRPVMEVINSVGIALVLCIGFRMIGRPVAPLEVGVLVAFNTYIRQFFGPINDLAEKYNNIQSSLVSADRVFDLIADESELEDPEQPGYEGIMRGEIEFRDVWFAYEGEDWVLRGLNFSCKSGDKLAFVGATGAGKTTIISLLSRFYVPQKGEDPHRRRAPEPVEPGGAAAADRRGIAGRVPFRGHGGGQCAHSRGHFPPAGAPSGGNRPRGRLCGRAAGGHGAPGGGTGRDLLHRRAAASVLCPGHCPRSPGAGAGRGHGQH